MSGYITVADLADELKMAKNTLRRYAIKHGLTMLKVRTPDSRGQATHALTPEDAARVRRLRREEGCEGPGAFAALTGEKAKAALARQFLELYEVECVDAIG